MRQLPRAPRFLGALKAKNGALSKIDDVFLVIKLQMGLEKGPPNDYCYAPSEFCMKIFRARMQKYARYYPNEMVYGKKVLLSVRMLCSRNMLDAIGSHSRGRERSRAIG